MSMDRDPNIYNNESRVDVREPRSSNTLAYLIGGLVIALGLLAFLFYDGGNRDVNTTGSTGATQSAPSTGAGPATSPAAPGTTAPKP